MDDLRAKPHHGRNDVLASVAAVAEHGARPRGDPLRIRHERGVGNEGVESSLHHLRRQSLLQVAAVEPQAPVCEPVQRQVEAGELQGPRVQVHEGGLLRVLPQRHDALDAAAAAHVQHRGHPPPRRPVHQRPGVLRDVHHGLQVLGRVGLLEVSAEQEVLLDGPHGDVRKGEEGPAARGVRGDRRGCLGGRDQAAGVALHGRDGAQGQQQLQALGAEQLGQPRQGQHAVQQEDADEVHQLAGDPRQAIRRLWLHRAGLLAALEEVPLEVVRLALDEDELGHGARLRGAENRIQVVAGVEEDEPGFPE
mmetsp:Transcript_58919/g.157505  ORF Transcript_58919/g.157505 Transcript_58919/m.157505 type:complete len:307 (+) Transcript_58919:500-1420(+)